MAARRGHIVKGRVQWESVYLGLRMLVDAIEALGGLSEDGIYRVSAREAEVTECDRAISQQGTAAIDAVKNPHVLSNVLKR